MGKVYNLAPRIEFEPIPTGDYLLRLMEAKERVQDKDIAFRAKGEEYVELLFEVTIPDSEPEARRVSIDPPKTFSAKSTWVKIWIALGMVDEKVAVEQGCQVDWDLALGRQCIGSIVCSPKKSNPAEWTDHITAYRPAAAAPTRRARQAPPAAQPPIDDDVPF